MRQQPGLLFIDDELYVLNSIKRNLGSNIYRTYFAQNAKEALFILENEEITVVLSDLQMPGVNGIELLEIIEKKYPKIVKMIISGNKQVSNVLAAVNKCMIFKYLVKPWDFKSEFLPALKDAVEYYERQEQTLELLSKCSVDQLSQKFSSTLENSIQELSMMQKMTADFAQKSKEDLEKTCLDVHIGTQNLIKEFKQILGSLRT